MSPSKRPRSRITRVPDRADYDLETVGSILDATTVCHLGLVEEGGFPVVIPMLHARDGSTLYLHGSSASRLIERSGEQEVCVTATSVDGLVLARSVFHHSVNYRSAVVFGRPERVEDPDVKLAALEAFTEKLVPGRWADARLPTRQELKGTGVLRMAIEEASAKVRTGGPIDEPEDYELAVWAGTIPLRTVAGEPLPDDRLVDGVGEPGYVEQYRRERS